jgi:pyruvate-formate lyase-activating enzyme
MWSLPGLGERMNVYHITYASKTKTANIHFYGCNFNCLGCIRKKSMYDIHTEMTSQGKIHLLSLDEVLKILEALDTKKAILLGGEPTIDPELSILTEKLHANGVYNVLLTNGHELAGELLENTDKICVSIKAYSDELHRKFTGKSNKNALTNFKKIYEFGVSLSSESIYIPGLIELEEIKKIAQFISSIDPNIPYHIDAYIPVNDLWRAPTPQEIKKAVKEAGKYLKNVTCLCGTERLKYKVFKVV